VVGAHIIFADQNNLNCDSWGYHFPIFYFPQAVGHINIIATVAGHAHGKFALNMPHKKPVTEILCFLLGGANPTAFL